mmetsp:Transcript_16115/g.52448  ORF Transcript_16115/g.52448 Transcript_16115/m.52448 type:complete len:93 (+) Transcript_16115:799-1077(+)
MNHTCIFTSQVNSMFFHLPRDNDDDHRKNIQNMGLLGCFLVAWLTAVDVLGDKVYPGACETTRLCGTNIISSVHGSSCRRSTGRTASWPPIK